MATYVLGDLHGCFESLRALLAECRFRSRRDSLWLVGDLVNRGPRSLEVLEWAAELSASLGDRFRCVLGNHDLHLIARFDGLASARAGDSLEPVLASPRAGELVGWLASRPLLVDEREALMVHAGLWPDWTLEAARAAAADLSSDLACPERRVALLGAEPSRSPVPESLAGRRFQLSVLTRMRCLFRECLGREELDREGALSDFTGPPEEAPAGLVPWYELPDGRRDHRVVLFGHWSTLGVRRLGPALCLDGACVWGGTLNALRLEDDRLFSVAARE